MTFTIPTLTDNVVEGPETVQVNLGDPSGMPVGASVITVTNGQAEGTITNTTTLTIAISDAVAVDEGQSLQFTVSLTAAARRPRPITIPLTYAGSADPVLDLDGEPVLVTIPAGAASVTVTVPTLPDTLVEGGENVTITLGTPDNPAVTVTDGEGQGSINDTSKLTVAISDCHKRWTKANPCNTPFHSPAVQRPRPSPSR